MNEQYNPFEALKHLNENGQEYWSARELAPILEYKEWRNFLKVILKAMQGCEVSEHNVSDHFVEANKMVSLGSGSQRKLEDIQLITATNAGRFADSRTQYSTRRNK